ncbi:MAG: TonB-dependent receptor plug domain-containing protein, partial [Pseudomonadota bacterium]
MRVILLAGGVAAAFGTAWSPLWAQEPVEMGELLITGGRTPIETDQTGRAFTVITGEQLEARGTRYLADALRQVPGLAVSRTGSFGGFTQIRVRGAEANQVLVLVDGVELAPAGSGEVDFGSLIVSDIERIEVLRGPQSAL